MALAKFVRFFGYTASSIVSIVGILIIAGLFIPSYISPKFRVMLGIVFVLYGIYRILSLRFKPRQDENQRM